jgi:transcriptional regulator with AAA-type ATPase domain
METLLVYRGELVLRRIPLADRPLAVGRALHCDVVVDDVEVAAEHCLVMRRGGTLVVWDVSRGPRHASFKHHLPFGERVAVGREHALERVQDEAGIEEERRPRSMLAPPPSDLLALVVGRGATARRIPLGDGPLEVGRSPDADIVVADSAVCGRHFRLEPSCGGVLLRDLGSVNGTWVNGMRVECATLSAGARITVGRTELAIAARASEEGMVAESSSMLEVLAEVQQLARLPWPVLIAGESGTGKEGLARALHDSGPRRERPFVALNAGGLPADLVESELFGHERGAFTGASAQHRGVFEQADGGTLFLDEIGELPLSLQARLLRVLESSELRRVGAETTTRVDVRLVCATHRDLRAMVADGSFRQDLFFRIARLVVQVPALRFRPEDVRALAHHFLRQMADEVGLHTLSDAALRRLEGHTWPGNARELRNVLSAAAASSVGARIEAADVGRALAALGGRPTREEPPLDLMRATVREHDGNLSAAARALHMPRSTLRDRLRSAA